MRDLPGPSGLESLAVSDYRILPQAVHCEGPPAPLICVWNYGEAEGSGCLGSPTRCSPGLAGTCA